MVDQQDMVDELYLLGRKELNSQSLDFATKLWRNPGMQLVGGQNELLFSLWKEFVCGVRTEGQVITDQTGKSPMEVRVMGRSRRK